MNDFFASVYEYFYYEPNFSQAVYTSGLYTLIGLGTFLIPLITCLIYYKVIDRPNLSNVFAWMLFGVAGSIAGYGFTHAVAYGSLSGLYDFSIEYISLSLQSLWISAILYIILSLVIKNISINCKNVPL